MNAAERLQQIIDAIRNRDGPMKADEWARRYEGVCRNPHNDENLHRELQLRTAEYLLAAVPGGRHG